MAQPADVIAEMKTLGIGRDATDDHDGDTDESGLNGHSPIPEEVARHRRTITEISAMADKMSGLIQEIRNTSRETDERLRQMETDLKILGLED